MKLPIHLLGVLVVAVVSSAVMAEMSAYEKAVREDAPAVYLRFEEPRGAKQAINSAERGGAAGEYSNADLGHGSAAPALGNAARFSGAPDGSSHVRVGGAPLSLTGDLTLELWVKPSQLGDGEMMGLIAHTARGEQPASNALAEAMIRQGRADSKGKRPPAQFTAGHESGEGDNTIVRTGAEAQVGLWYHLAFVRSADARTWQVFINGVADAPPRRYGENADGGSDGALLIGALNGFHNAHFAGLIDEVAIYPRPLPAERITAHYKAALSGRGLKVAQVQIAAHRGASMHAPENTAVAYQQAIEQGADIVELDIQSSKDGVPMLMHDRTLARTTGAKGKTADYTAADLVAMDAGKWKDARYAGEKVPTLETVARLCKGKATIFLDLKENGMGRAMADALKRAGVTLDQVIAGPWDDKVAADVQSAMPGVTMMLIGRPPAPEDGGWNDAWFEQQKARGYNALWFNFKYLTQDFIDAAHRHGLPVHAWTINDPATMSTAIFAGVDGIVTDDPATLRKLRETLAQP